MPGSFRSRYILEQSTSTNWRSGPPRSCTEEQRKGRREGIHNASAEGEEEGIGGNGEVVSAGENGGGKTCGLLCSLDECAPARELGRPIDVGVSPLPLLSPDTTPLAREDALSGVLCGRSERGGGWEVEGKVKRFDDIPHSREGRDRSVGGDCCCRNMVTRGYEYTALCLSSHSPQSCRRHPPCHQQIRWRALRSIHPLWTCVLLTSSLENTESTPSTSRRPHSPREQPNTLYCTQRHLPNFRIRGGRCRVQSSVTEVWHRWRRTQPNNQPTRSARQTCAHASMALRPACRAQFKHKVDVIKKSFVC